uniref:Uncharacterized protein n=1 Tax=Panagrolaimus sp. JU765 TaxID=591449 RepID=A0AC34RSI1_9BILA
MRDLRSFTGINSTQNIFAVSPGAEFVLFKKSSKELYYFDPELTDNNISLILIVSDHLHLDDTIFDLFFQNEQLVILLQNPEDGKISIGLCFIDLETHSVVVTEIKTIELQTKSKGGFSKLITDELGAIFISFPSTFENDNPKLREIEIFHLSDYLETGFNRTKKLCIEQRKLKSGG